MNWKTKLNKPFQVGDTVKAGNSRYTVIEMEGGQVTVKNINGTSTHTGTEKEYFSILTKVEK